MIYSKKKINLVFISCLIALSIMFIRIIPNTNSVGIIEQDSTHRIIGNIIGDVNIQSNQHFPTSSRKLSESNSPQSNCYFDRYDLTPSKDITDSKKIYRGGFSECHRFKAFLSIHFSTST
jgi:hypothetical protein